MKRSVLKQLGCVLGIVFMTIPAWSAVPTSLLPEDGSLQQTRVTADFDTDMILAKGGKSNSGSGSRGGNDASGSGQGGNTDNGGQGGNEDNGQGVNDDSGGPHRPGNGTCDGECDGEPDRLREKKQLQGQLQVQEQSQLQIHQQLWLQTQLEEHTSAGNGGPAQ